MTLTKKEYLETVLSAMEENQLLHTRLLISVDRWRGLEEAKENYELMLEFLRKSELGRRFIVGI